MEFLERHPMLPWIVGGSVAVLGLWYFASSASEGSSVLPPSSVPSERSDIPAIVAALLDPNVRPDPVLLERYADRLSVNPANADAVRRLRLRAYALRFLSRRGETPDPFSSVVPQARIPATRPGRI